MSREQSSSEVTPQSQPVTIDAFDLLNYMLQESGKSFRRMLATLHQYMDVLSKNIMLIASLTRHEDLRDDAKCQVYSFLLDCEMFLDILSEHSSEVENIRNNLKVWERMDDYTPMKRPRMEMYSVLISSCMGHFNYLQTSSPIYTNFVNNLQFGQEILRSDSSHFLAKVIIVKFYMEYAKEIRAIADHNRAAMFATRACLLLKKESFENAIEEEVSPDVQASSPSGTFLN
ncbi:hypothetical protein ACTXT7_014470 [Hymenolepis weldensis]